MSSTLPPAEPAAPPNEGFELSDEQCEMVVWLTLLGAIRREQARRLALKKAQGAVATPPVGS